MLTPASSMHFSWSFKVGTKFERPSLNDPEKCVELAGASIAIFSTRARFTRNLKFNSMMKKLISL